MTHRQMNLLFAYGRRIVFCLLCVFGVLAIFPNAAFAHPMGNFTTNRYSRIDVSRDKVTLLYIVDMAEIPTHSERLSMDTDRDKAISPQEAESYAADVAADLPAQLPLTLNGAE